MYLKGALYSILWVNRYKLIIHEILTVLLRLDTLGLIAWSHPLIHTLAHVTGVCLTCLTERPSGWLARIPTLTLSHVLAR